MNSLWLDLRHAARSLRRSRFAAIAAALSIGLSVGATAAVFNWMDGTVLHPFPAVADEGRLVGLEVGEPSGGTGASSYQTFKELRDATKSFSGMAAWRIVRVATREPGELGSSPLLATTVSGTYFEVLGVRPIIGRNITSADVETVAPVAMLGAQYWIDRYRGDRAVIGKTLLLNGQPVTVVGIAPPRFSGVYTGVVPHLYVPLTMQPRLTGVNTLDDRKLRTWLLFARLAPGVSIDAARQDADAAAKRITASYGDRPAPGAVVMEFRVQFLGARRAHLGVDVRAAHGDDCRRRVRGNRAAPGSGGAVWRAHVPRGTQPARDRDQDRARRTHVDGRMGRRATWARDRERGHRHGWSASDRRPRVRRITTI
jgi:hypothetical protein